MAVTEREQANGVAYLEALPAEPSGLDPVLCVHGFPESSYTWRHLAVWGRAYQSHAEALEAAGLSE